MEQLRSQENNREQLPALSIQFQDIASKIDKSNSKDSEILLLLKNLIQNTETIDSQIEEIKKSYLGKNQLNEKEQQEYDFLIGSYKESINEDISFLQMYITKLQETYIENEVIDFWEKIGVWVKKLTESLSRIGL